MVPCARLAHLLFGRFVCPPVLKHDHLGIMLGHKNDELAGLASIEEYNGPNGAYCATPNSLAWRPQREGGSA